MTCQNSFDTGIARRDQAAAALSIVIGTLTAATPLVPTVGALTPLGAALAEVQTAKAAAGAAVAGFQQASICFALAGDGAAARKAGANASEAVKATVASGQAEGQIQGAMAACIFVFPSAIASVAAAIAEASAAVQACQAIAT